MFKRKETPAVCRNTGAGVFFINRLKSKWEGKRMQNETAKENLLPQIRKKTTDKYTYSVDGDTLTLNNDTYSRISFSD